MTRPTHFNIPSLFHTLLCLLVVSGAVRAEAQSCTPLAARGPARIAGGTVVSDKGTPLRGLRYSLDIHEVAPPAAVIASLPCRGMNALHVYAEKADNPGARPPGYNRAALLDLVATTRQNGLYLVVTVGGQPNFEFAKGFWREYAGTLGAEPHVILEVLNEPWHIYDGTTLTAQPFPDHARQFEAEVYDIVRGLAPNSMVLLMSYTGFHNANAVNADIANVEYRLGLLNPYRPIDWTRTAVAFHGYSGASATSATISNLRGFRPDVAVMETELACLGGTASPCASLPRPADSLYQPLLELYEYNTHGSWLSFLDLPTSNVTQHLDTHWNQTLVNYGIAWAPDTGSFPISGITNLALRSYYGSYVVAEGGGGSDVNCDRSSVGSWETFALVDLNGGALNSDDQVQLRASNGMYVVAEQGGGYDVNANRPSAGPWETFTVVKMNPSTYTATTGTINYGDSIALRSSQGYYVVAEGGGGGALNADRTGAAQWETFTVTRP